MALADLGFSSDQERVYLLLLAQQELTVPDLAAQLKLDYPTVAGAVAALTKLGVLKSDPGNSAGVLVPNPAAAVGDLIERCEDDAMRRYRRIADTRSVISDLDRRYTQAGFDDAKHEAVERLEDVHAIRERLEELSFFTRTSVYSIQPGGPQSRESLEASRPLDQRGIRRGVEMRVIHEASVLDDELNRAYLRELVMGGAKVRVTAERMDRMVIMDGEVAVVPVDPANSRRGALIVRHPGLISGFLDLFNRAWQDSSELPWQTEGSEPVVAELPAQDKRILQLLASGCTDETSAREVGVSVRHLRRTISRLMLELGANSRFEAGVEAARRGWL